MFGLLPADLLALILIVILLGPTLLRLGGTTKHSLSILPGANIFCSQTKDASPPRFWV